MKKILLTIKTIFIVNFIFSQNCIVGNVTFNSQLDVDNFVIAHTAPNPTCDRIVGNLYITGTSDLSGLSFLNEVTGNLTIVNNNILNLNGINLISNIGGFLSIVNNTNITSIIFPNIDSITWLRIDGNSMLTNVELINLLNCSSEVTVVAPNLNSVDLRNLLTIPGKLVISATISSLSFTGNYLLINCSSLQNLNLNSITNFQAIDIRNNQLTDLTSISNVSTLGSSGFAYLRVSNSQNLTSLNGLENLTEINSYIQISGNSNLTNLDGISNITTVNGNVTFAFNSQLTTINNLNVKSILGNLNIQNNDLLTDITFLNNIVYIENDLNISNNPVLSDCCLITNFFKGKGYIKGNINISNNTDFCNSIVQIIENCKDTDNDGIFDNGDNCINTANNDQIDYDNDGVGDLCDNCPTIANANQDDLNGNGIGDVCEGISGNNNGGVGIGTTNPRTQFEVYNGDIYIPNIHRGIIFKTSDGKCYRFKPNFLGKLIGKEITCPN